MKDFLQRFLFENSPIRGEFIRLDRSFKTIVNQHPYPPAIRKLLGEALSVAGLLSAIIKFDGRLTVQFRSKDKLKLLLAQCDNRFHMRGLVKWEGDISAEEELLESLKHGVLVIMLDGPKNRYQGIVSWIGNSLTESIEGYFKESEQLTTKLWLTVNESFAAGFLLQIVPTRDKHHLDLGDHTNLDWDTIVAETNANLDLRDLHLADPQLLLPKIYPNQIVRLFQPESVTFHCTCSRKRSKEAIVLLGWEEANEELKNKQSMVVTCDFCNKEYIFDRVDVNKIFKDQLPPPQLH